MKPKVRKSILKTHVGMTNLPKRRLSRLRKRRQRMMRSIRKANLMNTSILTTQSKQRTTRLNTSTLIRRQKRKIRIKLRK